MRKLGAIAFLAVMFAGCMPGQFGAGASSGPEAEPTFAELRDTYGPEVASEISEIRTRRQAALAAPASFPDADLYADKLIAGLKKNYVQVQRIDWRQYMKDATDVLASATAPTAPAVEPVRAADALTKRAILQYALGDDTGARASVRGAFGKAHTYMTGVGMVGVLVAEKNPAEAKVICEKTNPLAKQEEERYDLMAECLKTNQGEPPEQTLTWASPEDWTMYKRRSQEQAERNLARRQAEEEADRQRRERMAAQQSSQPAGTPASGGRSEAPGSSGPRSASFTLRNECRQTVKLFFGETPKFGSGRTDTMSGNSLRNERMDEGKMIWIVDDSGNGISSYTVSANVREVAVNSSCTGFQTR